MDLKKELENDLKIALLVDKKHAQKLDPQHGRDLIGRVKESLQADIIVAEHSDPTAEQTAE